MSAKGKIVRYLGSALLREATVVEATALSGFRRLRLRSGAGPMRPSSKVQLLLPDDDMRTYTPITTARGEGEFLLLGYVHAGGPGAAWIRDVPVGANVRFVGPQRSLDVPAGDVVVVGDETSIAVAATFAAEGPRQVRAVIEAGEPASARAAAESVDLRRAEVLARGSYDAMATAVLDARRAMPSASIALTGGATLITEVRRLLRAAGVSDVKTKTYWVPGRRGLD